METWGGLFGIPRPTDENPNASLKFWARANQAISDQAKSLGSNRYLQVNFDRMCHKPDRVIDEIITFLGVNIDESTYQKARNLPKIPSSMGRHKTQDLSQFDKEDLATVESFGFTVE